MQLLLPCSLSLLLAAAAPAQNGSAFDDATNVTWGIRLSEGCSLRLPFDEDLRALRDRRTSDAIEGGLRWPVEEQDERSGAFRGGEGSGDPAHAVVAALLLELDLGDRSTIVRGPCRRALAPLRTPQERGDGTVGTLPWTALAYHLAVEGRAPCCASRPRCSTRRSGTEIPDRA